MKRNQQDVSVCLWLTEENQEECLKKLLAVAKSYDATADVAIADTLDSGDDEEEDEEDEDDLETPDPDGPPADHGIKPS